MKITDEMVEAVRNTMLRLPLGAPGIRAGLEAVAPLIIEECAKACGNWDDKNAQRVSDLCAAAIRALAAAQQEPS